MVGPNVCFQYWSPILLSNVALKCCSQMLLSNLSPMLGFSVDLEYCSPMLISNIDLQCWSPMLLSYFAVQWIFSVIVNQNSRGRKDNHWQCRLYTVQSPSKIERLEKSWLFQYKDSELKTLDILNLDYFIWVSNQWTHFWFFFLKPFFLGYSREISKPGVLN